MIEEYREKRTQVNYIQLPVFMPLSHTTPYTYLYPCTCAFVYTCVSYEQLLHSLTPYSHPYFHPFSSQVNPFKKEEGREYLRMRTHNRLRWSQIFPSPSKWLVYILYYTIQCIILFRNCIRYKHVLIVC